MLALGTATPSGPSDALRWSQVRPGLTRTQVGALVGAPLLRNAARGYERWIYDGGCEVQFERGEVTAWIAPKNTPPAPTLSRRDAPLAARRT